MTIAFANHKGGTGKTTSVANIGRALARSGRRILLIDLDPQGNLSYSLGVSGFKHTSADYLLGEATLENSICHVHDLDLLPADERLYDQLPFLEQQPQQTLLLKSKLDRIERHYDFILIDCPPAISLYTRNALIASDGVIIPIILEALSVQGMDQIIKEIRRIQKTQNAFLEIIGVLGVIVNENRRLCEEILEFIRDNYQVHIFNNHIRNCVKAAESPSFAKAVIDYAPSSNCARDYTHVTYELVKITESTKINI